VDRVDVGRLFELDKRIARMRVLLGEIIQGHYFYEGEPTVPL
jgi:hypothetical protein